jgi:hypothetical protein
VSAVRGIFDAIVGGFIINGGEEFMPGGVAEGIVSQVSRETPIVIAKIILPAIGGRVSALLPEETTTKIKQYAAHGISHKATHDIVEELIRDLVANIHPLVQSEMPKVCCASGYTASGRCSERREWRRCRQREWRKDRATAGCI